MALSKFERSTQSYCRLQTHAPFNGESPPVCVCGLVNGTWIGRTGGFKEIVLYEVSERSKVDVWFE